MKKRSIAGILAAVICAAALINIFLWPHPLYDIAWLGVGRGDPEIVRIKRVAFGEGEVGTYDVTLSLSDSAVFLEDMRDASARFPIPGRMGSITSDFYEITLSNQYNARSEISISSNGAVTQEEPANRRWGEGTFLLYYKDAETFMQICRDWTSPDGRYPGLAFLQEFFAIDKDDWATYVWLDAPDGVYGGGAVETLHSGIKPYMTEHGFNKVLMDRSLYRLEYICKQKGSDWTCSSIEVAPASEPGYYTYRVNLVEYYTSGSSGNLVFAGNYYIGEDGLVDSFYVDLD